MSIFRHSGAVLGIAAIYLVDRCFTDHFRIVTSPNRQAFFEKVALSSSSQPAIKIGPACRLLAGSLPSGSSLVDHFPCLSVLTGVHLVDNRRYFRPYAWLGRGDEKRDDKGGHVLRKRPWGREGPMSSRMPHELFCPSQATC